MNPFTIVESQELSLEPNSNFSFTLGITLSNFFAKKSLETILTQSEGEPLKRTLTTFSLILLGIGAVIGAGLFIRTAAAAANNAGPSVTLAYILAGIGCTFAGLCYAEFASRIPIAGSAYTYSYATFGELVAWIIGWDLVLEYAFGASTVAIAWSQYLSKLLSYVDIVIPKALSHSPFETFLNGEGVIQHGIINLPALLIVILISLLLIRGMSGSALLNNIIVIIKIGIVLLFITLGWQFINPQNQTPYIPSSTIYIDSVGMKHHFGGPLGILGAAGVVFFAFIGFDAVSTAAQETIKPQRAMPIGILTSLMICTILYILFSYVLTGVASTDDFRYAGKEASITYAIQTYMTGYGWLAKLMSVAILVGLTSVLLVLLMAQSRIFYSMSQDGLLPKLFSDVHSRYKTPYKSNLLFICMVGLQASFAPGAWVGNMTSTGTLFAFMLVCGGILVLRKTNPIHSPDHFRTPFVPWVPLLGIFVCATMIYGLGWINWVRLLLWMAIGLVVYFTYSVKRSHIQNLTKLKKY